MELPLKIGITGGIATGKSTVSKLFAQLGVPIIDADVIAHALVEPGSPTLKQIIQTFGAKIIHRNGRLNRAKLRELIFASHRQRLRLEAILHPKIRRRMNEELEKLQATNRDCTICLLSIPLLLETQQMDMVDRVLVVDCSPLMQRQRLMKRFSDKTILAVTTIEQILKVQAHRNARLAIADDIINNYGSLGDLQKQVLTLYRKYCAMGGSIKTLKNAFRYKY
jgi:dephospho-CoA kinase